MKLHARRVLVVLACFIFCLQIQSEEQSTLQIWFSNGTTTKVQLYTRPQVTFEGDRIVFKSPVTSMSYAATDVLRFTFLVGTPNPVGIISPKSSNEDNGFRQEGEQIVFDENVKPSAIQLFSEDGRLFPINATAIGNRITVSLNTLPIGVYVLSVNGRTSKIVKK